MDVDVYQLAIAVVGGGGVTGLVFKLWQIVREHQTGQLQREDTTISRWQTIAEREEREKREMEWELRWYRRHYAEIWVAYSMLSPPDKTTFPSVAPPPPKTTDI